MHTNDQSTDTLPKRIAVFGSGGGSNARALVEWSIVPANNAPYTIGLVVATSATAGITSVAADYGIPLLVLERSIPADEQTRLLLEALADHGIDMVALAGYLRRVETAVIDAVHGHILNIHPSLLPKYGGQGMYGAAVHQAVINGGDRESGATVHIVNARYDEGRILAQERVAVDPGDSAVTLAAKVLDVEHQLYPRTIANYVDHLVNHESMPRPR